MQHSDSIAALAASLAKAQGAIKGAVKDSDNPHFKSKYADLASVWEACREALSSNGIAVVQSPGTITDGRMFMTTLLCHQSGEWISDVATIPLGKADAHGYGSATTYARRFALAAFVGVAPEDDDGNAATAAAPKGKDFTPAPDGPDFHGAEGKGRSAYAAKKDGGSERFNALKAEIESLGTMSEVGLFIHDRKDEIADFPEAWRKLLRESLDEQKAFIAAQAEPESEAA